MGASWSPDSRTLLLAYASAPHQLVSLHFTAEPPSLQAQLLPVLLPEIAASPASECPPLHVVLLSIMTGLCKAGWMQALRSRDYLALPKAPCYVSCQAAGW